MQNESQNETQNEAQGAPVTEVTATKQEYRLEFIPLALAATQFSKHTALGRVTFEALLVVTKALQEINPEHKALEQARFIMARSLPIMSDLMKGDDMIDEARKRTNEVLYGVQEIYTLEETQDAESAA